jgi:amino acid transporter
VLLPGSAVCNDVPDTDPSHETVLSVTLVSCVSFLVTSNNAIQVFDWFVGLTSAGLIINETATYVVVVHWHHAIMAQKLPLDLLPYKSPLAPYTGYWGILVGICIILTLGFDTFAPWDTKGFITSYFGVGYFVVLFVAWKVWHQTRYIPSIEADIWTGKAEIDEECLVWESGEAKELERERRESMGVWKRAWESMW